ncbi:MAG: response regulator [Acidobacteria bacterium]|nr:response regulator [Acidobacteriota bacterium]
MAKKEQNKGRKKELITAKILVVEDEPSIMRLTEMILSRAGMTVLKAADGNEAYQMALTDKPDAILLDVNVPGMDGFTLCSKLKAQEETAKIPVAFLTARKEIEAYRTAQDLGGLLYIPKPFKPEALVQAVGLLLAARGKKS